MKDLRLPMQELTFDELVTLGRSLIPTVAPAWTDHNVHDPGIMLVELLAWIAEAQIYSVSRMRTDERRAYARLLGVTARGPRAATGLIWPFAGSGARNAPPMSWSAGQVLIAGTELTPDRPDAPSFYVSQPVQLTTARLVRVETRFTSGASQDWTRANTQEVASFMPFGDAPAAGDRLELTFEIEPGASLSSEAPFSLGFEILNAPPAAGSQRRSGRLRVSLRDATGEQPIDVKEDSTNGLLKSGVLLLPVARIIPDRGRFILTLRSATGGFDRPPRIRRIGINVIPVVEMHEATDTPSKFGRGQPDQQHDLLEASLIFPDEKFSVKVAEEGTFQPWKATHDLGQSGPDDRSYELDTANARLTFGNGVNGRMPPLDAALLVQYHVTGGARGNVPKDVRWTVKGIAGEFGSNREATAGGANAQTLQDLRSLARQRIGSARPLVTSSDLVQAALMLTDLGVSRASEAPSSMACALAPGGRLLVVVGPRDDDGIAETSAAAESSDFLAAVRSRLAPRLPLGQRLEVTGPILVPLSIEAKLTAARNTDPNAVQARAVAELRKRLAIVTATGRDQWPFDRDVTDTAVKGWLRKVDGVARVDRVALSANDRTRTVVKLGPMQLPLLQLDPADITVSRPAAGRAS